MYHKLHMGTKKSRKKILAVLTAALATWLLGGSAHAQETLKVATTIGMVADLVKQVGGERVEVEQLMGPGVDPHHYKPTSTDASRLSRADVIFYSGLMLEGRMGTFLPSWPARERKFIQPRRAFPRSS